MSGFVILHIILSAKIESIVNEKSKIYPHFRNFLNGASQFLINQYSADRSIDDNAEFQCPHEFAKGRGSICPAFRLSVKMNRVQSRIEITNISFNS